jgi:hypothetical protein
LPQWAAPPEASQKDQTVQPHKGVEPPEAGHKASRTPRHIFWVIPAFKVDYGQGFQPLTKKQKFEEWAQATYDPSGIATAALEAATLEHSSSGGFCDYGHGGSGFAKCFGSLELDAAGSGFLGDFLFPVLLHQDPRFFRLGEGSIRKRIWYAASRVFVTYNDSGHTVLAPATPSAGLRSISAIPPCTTWRPNFGRTFSGNSITCSEPESICMRDGYSR